MSTSTFPADMVKLLCVAAKYSVQLYIYADRCLRSTCLTHWCRVRLRGSAQYVAACPEADAVTDGGDSNTNQTTRKQRRASESGSFSAHRARCDRHTARRRHTLRRPFFSLLTFARVHPDIAPHGRLQRLEERTLERISTRPSTCSFRVRIPLRSPAPLRPRGLLS